MSELYEFVKKRTANFSGISCRKLYGLDAFYLNDKPFVVISASDQIVVIVEDFEAKKSILKIPQVTQWKLDENIMDNWYVLPESFNKKKNKLTPILEMTSKVLLKPKKQKKKRKAKPNSKNKELKKPSMKVVNEDTKPSLFGRLFKFFT
jgi:hypothetical protein